jgi:deazaflavin-dependent oxidoreductase (nitroreductase family)
MNSLKARRLLVWVLSRIHKLLYRASDGRAGNRIQGPVLLLNTVGRKTGRVRTTPLLYLNEGTGWAVIGSYGGDPKHPQWWLNLKANPKADVQIRSAKIPVRAREASGEERDRLWLGFVAMYAGYLQYERRTSRRFPIAVLKPVE